MRVPDNKRPESLAGSGHAFFNSPYIAERNLQGSSLNVGLIYSPSKNYSIEYVPNLRYDCISKRTIKLIPNSLTPVVDFNGDTTYVHDFYYSSADKKFIIDHNFNLIFRKKINWGGGVSIINTGQSFFYEYPTGLISSQSIEYTSYNAFVLVPIKKVYKLELKLHYIGEPIPRMPANDNHMLIGLRIYRSFSLPKIKNRRGSLNDSGQ